MEDLCNKALDVVGQEGDTGLPVSQLWPRLGVQALSEESSDPLITVLQESVWKKLLSYSAGGLTFKGSGGVPLAPSAPELASAAAAQAAGVHIVACSDLQDAIVGVYGRRLAQFKLSELQRKVLNILSAAKHRGELQSELAARVGKEPNNFFYVIKGLEERGLVVKRAAVLQQKKGQSKSTLSTNLIHLAKYAPQGLGETSRVTDGGCTTLSGGVPMFRGASGSGAPPAEADWQSDDEDAAGDDDGMEEDAGDDAAAAVGGVASSFQIVDEDAKLARITTQLVALENHTALERDLKAALGFTSTPGHRQWRRLRALLMRKGCIEQFIGYLAGGRVASFVRLLKPWVAGVGDDGGPAPGDGDDEGILRGVVDAFGHLDSRGEKVAELTIDRQVLAMIAVAGREGLTTAQVDAGLRLNMKRNGPRLEDFKDRFSKAGKDFQVEEASINQGRTILRRYTATPALAEALAGALDGQTEPPVPPPGGWVAGVLEAAAAGLPQHEIDEVLQGNGAGPALGSAPPGPATDGAGPSGAAEPAPAVRPAKKMPAKGKKRKASGKARATRGSDADTKTESSSSDSSSGSETEDERGTAKEALPKGRRLVTEIGQRRRQWLVEKVNSEGLLLTMEVGRVLQNADRASGNMAAIMPDRKVYMRVINAAAAAGEVSVLHVTLPNVQGSMNSRQQTVVARPGTTIDQPGFVESVFQRYRALQKRVRTATHVRQQALNQEQAGFQLPTLAVQPLPAATEHGGALREHRFRAMVANGYATARMLRCRAIHDAAWEIISTRNGPSGDVDPGLVTAAGENRVFLVTRSPDASVTGSAGGGGPSSSGGRLSMLAFSATPEQMELVLTAEELWRGIRVDTYLACLGCASTDQAAVARLRRGNKTLGELSAKELLTLAGNEAGVDLARSLLTRNMDLLHRMGLVSSVVPVEVSAAGVVGTLHGGNASAYVLRQQGVYEEPEAAPASRGAADSNPSGSDGDGDADEDEEEHPAGAAQLKKLCHEFDITTESGREAYWLSMEFMVVCAPITGARQRGMVDSSLLLKCFPFVNAPEAASDRTWIGRNGATQEQLALVRPELKRFGQEHMTWREALAIAQRLNVPFEAVARAVVTKRSFGQGKATGRGAQRLGGLRVTREKSTVQRRRRRAKEEEVELEEDEEAEVVRPEVRRAPQAPERKRKWYAEEDRELLHAWAKWLGQNGPDKILKWSILKYRPRFAKAASCRYRLANLKAHPEMGAHVLKIQQLAAGVHSRRVLRQAAAEEDGHAADPNASPQGVETAAPGSKRGRGAGAPGGAKAKRAKGSPGGAAPAPIDVSNLPELFEIHDAADAQALKEVMEEVEIVVAGAPNRHKARSLRIQAKSSSRPGPMAKGSLALPIAGPAGGGRMLPLLRQWARAAAVAKASRAAGELPPTVAAAMDLVRSLLHPAAPQDEDAKTALAARFSDDDVKQAVLQLVRLNHVSVPEATGAAPEAAFTLSLSSKYKSETEPLFFLRNVLAEASQAAARVRRRAQAADERALSVMPSSNPNAPGPNGGTVAGLISMLAGGAAQLSASLPVASHLRAPRQPPTDVDALVDPDATAEEEEVLRVLSKVKVSATALPAAAASSHDDTATGSGSSVSHIKLSSPEEVLYQPSLVATDDALREEAEKACKKVFASRKIAGGARGAAALLHALQAAGAKGVSPSVCAAALPAGSDVDEAAATLCRFGLARKVDTFDGACLMSAAASQALLAFPPPALDNAASAHVTGVAAALAPLALPAPGHPQPLADVPLRPWVDHHGRINQDLWVGLVQRAVCAAMQCPGIKGDVLLQSVRVVNPQHGRELLRVLCKEGVLRTERTPGPDASSPKSVLDACFGGRSGEDEGSGDGAEVAHGEYGSGFFGGGDDDQWHFFAVPERCWGLEKVLPSQVILKQ